MSQVEQLKEFFEAGGKISDHESFAVLGWPNLRSRVSDLERIYGLSVQRKKVEGKNYLVYWMDKPKVTECNIDKPLDPKMMREMVSAAGQIYLGI